MSVERRLRSGLAWTVAESWGVQACNLLVFAVLAWLLPPAAFGMVALAHVYTHVVSVFADQGVASALVQRRELEPGHVDSAFWANLGVGAAFSAAGMLAAGPLAALWSNPELEPVFRWMSLVFVLNALRGVQDALLQRALRFRVLAVRSLVGVLGGGAAGVALAFAGWGVMAMVAQQLVAAALTTVFVWSVGGWRPGLRFSLPHLRQLYSFGARVVGVRLLNVASRRGDDLLVGALMGPVALGYYSVGYKLMKTLLELLGKVFTRVAFPSFSAAQSDPAELRGSIRWMLRTAGMVALPCFAAVAVLAADLVPLAFGPHWMPSVPVLRILAVGGAVQVLLLIAQQALLATGHAGWTLRLLLGTATLSVAGFAGAAALGGLAWVAAVYTTVALAAVPVSAHLLRRAAGVSTRDLWPALRLPLAAALAVAGVGLLSRVVLAGLLPPLPRVAAGLAAAGCAYALLVWRFEPGLVRGLLGGLRGRGAGKRRLPPERVPALRVDEAAAAGVPGALP